MENEEHRGLGIGGAWQGFQTLVYDPKLAAGRGVEYSAAGEDVGPLDDSVPVHYYPEGEATVSTSTNTPLDASNKGFQLLQRLGWQGKGLGRNEHGIVEPVSAGVDAGVRLGLGKQAEDDHYTAAENITRRKLEVEIQAEEAPERRERREAQALREQQIKEDVTQIKKTFYCQVCNKQYQTAMELEEHLSSYDHHHKKRLAEARAAELERTRDERARKEQRRQQREQQRLEEQIRRAQAAAGATQQPPPAAQPPLPPGQPPLPPHEPDSASAGGWGWSTAAPEAPNPTQHDAGGGGGGGWSSGGWSSQPAHAAASQLQMGGWSTPAAAASQQAPPPPPPPLPPAAAAGSGAPPPPPPPPSTTASTGMKFGMGSGGSVLAGRGLGRGAPAAVGAGRRPGLVGRGVAAAGGGRGVKAGAASKPAAAVFGESSSEDEAS